MKIKRWEDVGEAIKNYGLLMIDRRKIEGDLNKQITALKDRLSQKVESFDQQMEAIEQRVEDWCETSREDMTPVKGGKGLTWKCTFGKVGFRSCPPSITFTKKNMEKVLAALKERKLFNCVRTTEEPNKEAMELLQNSTLKEIGAKRSAAEKFELKPDYKTLGPQTTTPSTTKRRVT